jgi:hypothetical protein
VRVDAGRMEVWGEASAAMLRDGTAAALGHGGDSLMECRRGFRAAFGRVGSAGALGRSGVSGERKEETGRRRRGGDTRGPPPLLTRGAHLSATSIINNTPIIIQKNT